MVQTEMASTTRGSAGVGVWIFRILLVAAAAFMLYSWFQPWWSADIAVIKGDQDMVLHPWGADVAGTVRANIDESAFEMPFPQVFAGFMWVYLAVCMMGLAVSLFWTKTVAPRPDQRVVGDGYHPARRTVATQPLSDWPMALVH